MVMFTFEATDAANCNTTSGVDDGWTLSPKIVLKENQTSVLGAHIVCAWEWHCAVTQTNT